ncbi:hypothetical protein GALMADRAFT_63033 [Galerina marginata CBS 339.88]|uniref:Uncharacterized protein n=1 Tax=Galerina marginata (strain CBS 339.88) TaxID=685588 RepID=A0A067T987_GALM3|nr:hypothetical protein GALMADRAFT_63033 [Galerina marginata CBS 339.88]
MGVVNVPLQSYLGWKVAVSFLHAFAIGSTLYRLTHRFRIRRLWWDDYIVCVPVVLNLAICIMVWIRFSRRGECGYPLILNV